MKRIAISLLSLLMLSLPACSAPPKQYTQLEPRRVEVNPGQLILLELDHGEATLLPSAEKLGAWNTPGSALITARLTSEPRLNRDRRSPSEPGCPVFTLSWVGAFRKAVTIPLREFMKVPKGRRQT